MDNKRVERLNSLLKEVIAEVLMKDVRNPHMTQLTTVTRVDVSKDLHHAKVFVSVIGSDAEKQQTLEALESAAGFIAVTAAKKVVLRYFPVLTFRLDSSVDKHMRIDDILGKIHNEQQSRPHPPEQEE